MHIIALYAILTAGLTAAAPSTFLPSHAVEKRACRQIAICKNDNPQVGDTSDIAYIAQDMRSFGRASAGTQLAFFSMTPSIDCEEKRLPWESNPGFLPLIRHLKPAINSSVLLEDIADSIDGGENPTDASLRSSLLYRCGAKGGMVPVVANTSNSAYSTPEYIASKASPDGLAIEIINICGNLCK